MLICVRRNKGRPGPHAMSRVATLGRSTRRGRGSGGRCRLGSAGCTRVPWSCGGGGRHKAEAGLSLPSVLAPLVLEGTVHLQQRHIELIRCPHEAGVEEEEEEAAGLLARHSPTCVALLLRAGAAALAARTLPRRCEVRIVGWRHAVRPTPWPVRCAVERQDR